MKVIREVQLFPKILYYSHFWQINIECASCGLFGHELGQMLPDHFVGCVAHLLQPEITDHAQVAVLINRMQHDRGFFVNGAEQTFIGRQPYDLSPQQSMHRQED